MEQISAEERELRSAISGYVERMSRTCGMQLLDELEVLARQTMDMHFAGEMAQLVIYLVKCRKLSENFKEESLGELAYRFSGQVDWEELKYSIDRPPHRQ